MIIKKDVNFQDTPAVGLGNNNEIKMNGFGFEYKFRLVQTITIIIGTLE